MSNYTKTTDFGAKDSLPTGDSGKIIRGTEFETEFDAISTAIATKADIAGPTFTGTLTYETISDGTISITAFVDEDDMSSNSANLVPTQQSVKAYVDAVTTELQAQDLDFQADSGGALSIDLDTETMTFTGGTGIDTSGSGNAVTFAIDSTVATLTGTQTLTNKTLTAPTISGNLTTDGTIDGRDVATDGAKLDGIEAGATADQTAAEIRTLVDSASDSNVFTDADHTKLDGIEANATADQTAAEIRTLVDSASDSNVFTDSDHSKLDGIEAGATGDQTNAEIRAAVEAATDSNVFTDADHSKLDGIEALADVTDTTNVTAAGALMDSELTNITAVKSLDQGVATTDTPTFAGLATSANVTFGDNDKAIFGAGSDLEIYHDGSDSVIYDGGTGNLKLLGTNVVINNAGNTANLATFNDGSDVRLFFNGSQKLATTSSGIDVTGVITTDGMTTSADINFGDNDKAVFGAGSDLQIYHDGNDSYIVDNGTGNLRLQGVIEVADDPSSNDGRILFGDNSSARGVIHYNYILGDLLFENTWADSAGVFRFTANSVNALTVSDAGIDVTGTVTADGLTVDGNITNLNYGKTFFTNGIGTNKWQIWNDNGGTDKFQLVDGDGHLVLQAEQSGDISFYEDTGTTAKLFWDASAESLGIGVADPAGLLEVFDVLTVPARNTVSVANQRGLSVYQNQSNGLLDTTLVYGNSASSYLAFGHHNGTSYAERMRIDSSGNTTFKTSAGHLSVEALGGGSVKLNSNGSMGMNVASGFSYEIDVGGTEAMRIDSNRNLLVGTTDTVPSNNGASGDAGVAISPDGVFRAARSGNVVLDINRMDSDGAIADFRKDGSTVGSIGAYLGSPYIGTGDTGLLFETTNNRIEPFDTSALGAEELPLLI